MSDLKSKIPEGLYHNTEGVVVTNVGELLNVLKQLPENLTLTYEGFLLISVPNINHNPFLEFDHIDEREANEIKKDSLK